MHEDDFEAMSCALLNAEPRVNRADLYHAQRQPQYGIDAFGETATGLIVVSCKCYTRIDKGEMATWSDDFLKHWDSHWKSQKVEKFILSVACEGRSKERLADIKAEKARFAAVGVAYEVWTARQLQELLRPQRGIVSQYLPSFVDILCGTAETVKQVASPSDLNMADMQKRLADLIGLVSDQFKTDLDRCKDLLSAGLLGEVEQIISGIRKNSAWRSLDPELQARGIRLLGSVAICRDDISAAQTLSDEADLLAPAEEPRLKALIALNRDGITAALTMLGTPKTQAGWEMKASLHYGDSNLDAGDSALGHVPNTSGEYFRLRAYSQLLRSNAQAARAEIEHALLLSPDAVVVKRTSAMTNYALALSPHAPPYVLTHPQPVDWFLVKRDDASRALFLQAREAFIHISQMSETLGAARFEDIWVLACDCNLGDLESARVKAANLLTLDPANALVIAWVRSRRLDVDLSESYRLLMEKLRNGTLDENGPSCLEWTVKPDDRPGLLEVAKAKLVLGVDDAGLKEELQELVTRLDDPTWSDNPIVKTMMRATDADSADLESIYEELSSQTPTPPIITAVAGLLGDLGRWGLVVAHAELLLGFETADMVRLVSRAAYFAKDAGLSAKIFSQHADKFPGGRLPFELQRMEAEILLEAGQASEALRRANALVAQRPTPATQLWLAGVRAEIGDHQFAIPILQQAIQGDDLSQDSALEWSQRLVGEKPRLARDLWRHAMKQPLDDRLALPAWNIARLLGVVGEAPELMGTLQKLARAGDRGVWLISADELPQKWAEMQSQAGEDYAKWMSADAPVHLASSGNLAQLYDFDRTGDLKLQPILSRHGARAAVFFENPGPELPGFVMDVTGLLVADQCQVLDVLIDGGYPLFIGRTMVPALLAMEQALQTDDPGPVEGHEAVLKAIGLGIEVGYVTEATKVVAKAAPSDDGVADIASVIAALTKAGYTLDGRAVDAKTEPSFGTIPEPGQTLIFTSGTLSYLAATGALPPILSTFNTRLDEASVLFASDQVQRRTESQRVGDWLRKLRTLVAKELTDGRIKLIDQTKLRHDMPDEIKPDEAPIAANMMEVLSASEAKGNTLVWIEDRYVTGFATSGQTNVVCAFDILMELRRKGVLTDAEYFVRLLRLREGGQLFLPFRKEELHYHLSRAAVRDTKLIETPELATLARSIALHALYDGHLRIGLPEGDPPGKPNERQALMDLRKVAEGLIIELWTSDAPVAVIRAKSDWIWTRLRTDLYYRDSGNGSQPATLSLAAMSIAHLVSSVFSMAVSLGFGRWERRRAFLNWVQATVIGDRFDRDPVLREEFGRIVRQFFSVERLVGRPLSGEAYQLAFRTNRMIVAQCPPKLRDIILEDRGFAWSIGMSPGTLIELQLCEFDSDRFFRAAARALNYGRATIRTNNKRRKATFRLDRETDEFVLSGSLKGRMSIGQFAALARVVQTDAGDLRQTLVELDLPQSEWAEFANRLRRQPTATMRMKLIEDLREDSITWFLSNLFTRIEKRERFEVAAFAPLHFSKWLSYLRWNESVAGSLRALTDELGLEEALGRLCGLPVDLSGYESADEAAQFVSPSPMGLIHRLRRLSNRGPAVTADVIECLRYTFEAYKLDGELFCTLLTWGAQHFEAQNGWKDLPPEAKHAVVWTYADKITEIFQRVGSDGAAVTSIFKGNSGRFRPDILLRLEGGYNDSPAHHEAITPERLLIVGLEYAIGTTIDHSQLPEDIAPALLDIIGTEGEDGIRTVPLHPEYSAPVPGPETWLSRPHAGTLFENGELSGQVVSQAVADLDRDPNDLSALYQIVKLGGVALPEETTSIVRSAVERIDIWLLTSTDAKRAMLRLIGLLACRLGDDAAADIRNKLGLNIRARYLVAPEEEFAEEFDDMVEAVVNASRLWTGNGIETFASYTADLAIACPGVSKRLEPILANMVNLIPVDFVEPIWKAWLKMKAISVK